MTTSVLLASKRSFFRKAPCWGTAGPRWEVRQDLRPLSERGGGWHTKHAPFLPGAKGDTMTTVQRESWPWHLLSTSGSSVVLRSRDNRGFNVDTLLLLSFTLQFPLASFIPLIRRHIFPWLRRRVLSCDNVLHAWAAVLQKVLVLVTHNVMFTTV